MASCLHCGLQMHAGSGTAGKALGQQHMQNKFSYHADDDGINVLSNP